MATNINFNGQVFSIPAEGDDGWATALSNYFIAISTGALQKSGGTFSLTAEVDFGNTYGAKIAYLKSKSLNPAGAGFMRLGNLETVAWRNNDNTADLALTVGGDDVLKFNSIALVTAGSGSIVNADIATNAAIEFTKLQNLPAGEILVGNPSNKATPVAVTGAISMNDGGGTAINSGYITDDMIAALAAIQLSKLETLTADRLAITNGSGKLSASSVTATEAAYLAGATSNLQVQIDAKAPSSTAVTLTGTQVLQNKTISGTNNTITDVSLTAGVVGTLGAGNGGTGAATYTKGDILATPGGAVLNKLGVGTDGHVMTADSASTNGIKWAAAPSAFSFVNELVNLGLATSVGSSALTIALKQADGATNPSTGASAVKLAFRSSTLTDGSYVERSVTSALSLVVSSGSTLGTTSGNAHLLWVYAIDNAGTVELAVSQSLFDETVRVSTTAEGGAGAADSNAVMYSATARTNVAFRLIGRLSSTQTTAGTWASTPSNVSVGEVGRLSPKFSTAARYTTVAGQSIANASTVIIDYGTRIKDDLSCVTTGAAWKYTAAVAGSYDVDAKAVFASLAWTVALGVTLSLYKNGSLFSVLDARAPNATNTYFFTVGGYDSVDLAVGDYIDIRVAHGESAARAIFTSAGYNHVNISLAKPT